MQTEDNTPKARRWAGRTAALAAAVATLMIGSIAAATWTLSGEGSGEAAATTAESLTATLTSPALYPGLTADGTLVITNPNAFPVLVTEVTFSGDVAVGAPAGDCTPVNSAVTFTTATGLSIIVPAGVTDESFEDALANAIAMGTGSDNACQGKSFSRPFTLTAEIYVAP